ncbi:LysR substrate-binding domain-containing protein [Komagataeibacter rhaeticus]|nr:LysR substrate-binding domain-containing protein [Komagataeibacter rhaeticus]
MTRARTALEALQGVLDVAVASREPMSGLLRIGVIPTIGPFVMSSLVRRLPQAYPQLRLSLNEDVTHSVMAKLAMGRLDLVLLAMPWDCADNETLPLWRDPFMLVMPHDHPLAQLPVVPVRSIVRERMILLEDGHCLRDQTLAMCRQVRGWTPPGTRRNAPSPRCIPWWKWWLRAWGWPCCRSLRSIPRCWMARNLRSGP